MKKRGRESEKGTCVERGWKRAMVVCVNRVEKRNKEGREKMREKEEKKQ